MKPNIYVFVSCNFHINFPMTGLFECDLTYWGQGAPYCPNLFLFFFLFFGTGAGMQLFEAHCPSSSHGWLKCKSPSYASTLHTSSASNSIAPPGNVGFIQGRPVQSCLNSSEAARPWQRYHTYTTRAKFTRTNDSPNSDHLIISASFGGPQWSLTVIAECSHDSRFLNRFLVMVEHSFLHKLYNDKWQHDRLCVFMCL